MASMEAPRSRRRSALGVERRLDERERRLAVDAEVMHAVGERDRRGLRLARDGVARRRDEAYPRARASRSRGRPRARGTPWRPCSRRARARPRGRAPSASARRARATRRPRRRSPGGAAARTAGRMRRDRSTASCALPRARARGIRHRQSRLRFTSRESTIALRVWSTLGAMRTRSSASSRRGDVAGAHVHDRIGAARDRAGVDDLGHALEDALQLVGRDRAAAEQLDVGLGAHAVDGGVDLDGERADDAVGHEAVDTALHGRRREARRTTRCRRSPRARSGGAGRGWRDRGCPCSECTSIRCVVTAPARRIPALA